jgi:hypothetical protein
MKELLSLSVMSDKAYLQCMYTSALVRTWSLPHLKGGCCYLDWMKGFCPAKEEAEKSVNDALLDLDSGFVGYEENEHEEMDLSLLNEKESTKVLARMNKEAHRATLKKQKEEAKEKEKNRKAAEKAKKPHDKSIQKVAGKSLNILEVIIDASPSSQVRRRDAILVGLSFSTL